MEELRARNRLLVAAPSWCGDEGAARHLTSSARACPNPCSWYGPTPARLRGRERLRSASASVSVSMCPRDLMAGLRSQRLGLLPQLCPPCPRFSCPRKLVLRHDHGPAVLD